jgi:hypothetical protein
LLVQFGVTSLLQSDGKYFVSQRWIERVFNNEAVRPNASVGSKYPRECTIEEPTRNSPRFLHLPGGVQLESSVLGPWRINALPSLKFALNCVMFHPKEAISTFGLCGDSCFVRSLHDSPAASVLDI